MAGPSRHGVHLDVRPAHADDQMQRSGLQDAVTNHPQVALPFPKREPGCVLVARDVLALPRPLDPVLARPSDGTSGFTTSVAEQLPTPLFNGLPPLLPASQQPANLPSNGERINSYPTLNRREARLAALRADHIRDRDRECAREVSDLFTQLQRNISRTSSPRMDTQASVLKGAIKRIKTLEGALATALQTNVRVKPPAANTGLVCFDFTGDPNGVTAVVTQPARGSAPSTMASYLGANVAMHVCGNGCFITVMLPYRDPHHVLLGRISDVLVWRGVDFVFGFISIRDGTVVYNIECQARPTAHMISCAQLHAALQNVVNAFMNPTNQA
ncbi:hypothetical protein KC19_9G108500 [Ceratodon purpureus]|uniref:BHLH domain-containing protein n=1 Tax=Ceratodon purpureus TaxID=3225 RepID=A0A8T0GQT2_CERPU|nr:hypothetical protein KC19_9G108500 [Ceratodon purpureus]